MADDRSYSLAGSDLLDRLPRSFYDHPVFHHLPGFSILLAPFVLAKSPQLAVTLSWLGHSLALVAYELLLRGMPAPATMAKRFRCQPTQHSFVNTRP